MMFSALVDRWGGVRCFVVVCCDARYKGVIKKGV
jgi:hypothetical protein